MPCLRIVPNRIGKEELCKLREDIPNMSTMTQYLDESSGHDNSAPPVITFDNTATAALSSFYPMFQVKR